MLVVGCFCYAKNINHSSLKKKLYNLLLREKKELYNLLSREKKELHNLLLRKKPTTSGIVIIETKKILILFSQKRII